MRALLIQITRMQKASGTSEAGTWDDIYEVAPNYWETNLPYGATIGLLRSVVGRVPTHSEMRWLAQRYAVSHGGQFMSSSQLASLLSRALPLCQYE